MPQYLPSSSLWRTWTGSFPRCPGGCWSGSSSVTAAQTRLSGLGVAFGIDSLADLRKVDTVALRQADFDRQIFELQEEKRKLYESLVSGGIPLPKYKEQKEQISERLLEVQNTKAVVMARLEAEQEERHHQRQQMDISRMLTESDGLTSELVDLLIDKIYVYPDKRVDIAFKIRDSFTTHD